jgi:hypothetical protein
MHCIPGALLFVDHQVGGHISGSWLDCAVPSFQHVFQTLLEIDKKKLQVVLLAAVIGAFDQELPCTMKDALNCDPLCRAAANVVPKSF